jgi:hypothetical protein
MSLYVLMGAMMLVGSFVSPERLLAGMRPAKPEMIPWMQAVFAVIFLWAGTCVVLLIGGLKATASQVRG